MKINPDKFAKIYLSIIGGSAVTHSIYNMYNASIQIQTGLYKHI